MYVFFTYLYICCFFSIFIHMFLVLVCNLFISVSHKDVLMSVSEIQVIKVYLL